MKKVTSTLSTLFLCLFATAQVGSLDLTFNNAGTPGYVINNTLPGDDDYGQAISTHTDGRIVVAVYFDNNYFKLLRYTSTGSLDATFGTGGVVTLRQNAGDDAQAYAVQVLSDNKILVAGYTWGSTKDFALLKLNEDGTPDNTFGVNGWAVTSIGSFRDEARSLFVQNDGKILVAGIAEVSSGSAIYDFAVARYNANGTIDNTTFGAGTGKVMTNINANDIAESVIQQNDGKILVGGTSNENGDANYTVVRYNADGTIDNTTFGVSGIASIDIENAGVNSRDHAHGMVLQTDQKILLTGYSAPSGPGNGNVVTIRLTTAGVLDVTFNAAGAKPGVANFNYGPSNTDEGARTVVLQNDGKIIVGGDTDGASAGFALLLLRYNSDGTLDNTFDSDGIATSNITVENEFGYAIKLFGNRIYFAGSTGANFAKDFILGVYQNDGTPLPLVLSQFYAQKQTSKVVLQWQTASEEGVKQFVIERSNDGKAFKAIGTVAAAGNSTITKKYSFADQSPFTSTSNYYRLLIQDADGNYKYSKTLIIKFDGQLSTEMKVYPSIVKDILQVQLPDGMNGNIGIQLIDMNGRIVRRNNIAGDGNALNTTMDVSTLIKGVYIIKATAGNTSVTSRFTKQ